MSNNAIAQQDRIIETTVPTLLAILNTQKDKRIPTDSQKNAAEKCLGMMYKPGKLGRTHRKRMNKMRSVIRACMKFGYIEYVDRRGSCLKLTPKGEQALEQHRAKFRTGRAAYA
ncbi:hypothetical protein I8H83_05240 [Candidatus Saccharibacteria bacterium]|nr:hypothetical protein [Candidatus Saccharibacteria bacterium]MBH2007979.1 hypothetical protein [Candidatus Saccharibacteria bacterium]